MYKIHHYFQEMRIRIFYLFFSFFMTISLSYFFVDELFYIFTNIFFEIEGMKWHEGFAHAPVHNVPESLLKNKILDFGPDISSKIQQMPAFPSESFFTPESNIFVQTKAPLQFIFTDITEAFRTSLSLVFGFTCYIHIPFIVYHLWSFFIPSLFFYERKIFSQFCFFFLSLYTLATFSVIVYIFPILWNFFLNFETITEFLDIHCEARISSYYSFILKICLISHLFFQLPFFILIFLYFKFLNIFNILTNRRWIYWFILLFSATIAPPDALMQFIISSFMLFVLEISFFFILLYSQYKANVKNAFLPFHKTFGP